jgi:hypothetical protein
LYTISNINMTSFTISPIFAYLPNGIIREIVSYTGATYKKRNGKYIGQIPKNDERYNMLRTIPRPNNYTMFDGFARNVDFTQGRGLFVAIIPNKPPEQPFIQYKFYKGERCECYTMD